MRKDLRYEVVTRRDPDFSDLWGPNYASLSKRKKRDFGLHQNACILFRDRRPPRLVYACHRAAPNEGYEVGNFAIDQAVLIWALDWSRRNRIETFVVLVERLDHGYPIAWGSIEDVVRKFEAVEPFGRRKDNSPYYWVNAQFESIIAPRAGRIIDDGFPE